LPFVTNYSRGINGVMIDVAGLPGGVTPAAADFVLETLDAGGAWRAVPVAPTVSVRRAAGASGTDRVTLILPDGTAKNSWLRVTARTTTTTALATPDVFYFGNLVGDTGNDRGTPAVTATDYALTRAALFKTDAASLGRYDFNKDGRIDATDVLTVRNNQRHALARFALPPSPPAGLAQAVAAFPASALPRRPARRGIFNALAADAGN
jgi:hypothetical protein